VKYCILPLEDKLHIFAPPCNILYVYHSKALHSYFIPCHKNYSKSEHIGWEYEWDMDRCYQVFWLAEQ
jgi:hypothetical protein